MLEHLLKVTLRNLRKNKGYTFINVAGLAVGMAFAIVISCLGLFGLTAYTARRRTREIGIRKVLGASVSGILGLFVREIVLLVLVAGALGCSVAYFVMDRWLENFAFRTSLDPVSFGAVILFLLAIALATVMVQAFRAAVSNPVDAIRQE
jgi:putative ABC transport system permease protein